MNSYILYVDCHVQIALNALGVNLGWVYLFMGIVIGSAVVPLWNMMTWEKASGTGAVLAAWSGFALAVIGWLVGAQIQGGEISVASLGTNEVMLSGNLIAILSSGLIHYVYSKFVDPQNFDFDTLDDDILLVEQDLSGLGSAERDKKELNRWKKWIKRRGYVLTFVLIFLWPILSVPAEVFSQGYFALWVLISIAWGFGAAIVISLLPIIESQDDIGAVLSGIYNAMMGKEGNIRYAEEKAAVKEVDEAVPDEVAAPAVNSEDAEFEQFKASLEPTKDIEG